MKIVKELTSITELPSGSVYYIKDGDSFWGAVEAFRRHYYYYPEEVYAVRGQPDRFYFVVENWEEKKSDKLACPKCNGELLYDGLATGSWGEEGSIYRCVNCDYYLVLAKEKKDES